MSAWAVGEETKKQTSAKTVILQQQLQQEQLGDVVGAFNLTLLKLEQGALTTCGQTSFGD